MIYVKIDNLFKRYGDLQVLDNVSFTIQKGERFGLLGPNGAGKSTLIDIMTGMVPRDSGEIEIDKMKVPQDNALIRQNLGLVPQEIALIEDVTAKGNLQYFGGLYGLYGKELNRTIDELLDLVGLRDVAKKQVKTFSGGMKRRLNIIAAVLHKPKFLILDEPTVGVDAQSRNKIMEYIKYMNEEYHTTVLYTSHYMEEVESLCHRLLILDQGKEIAYGNQEDIKMLVQDQVKWKLSLKNSPLDFNQILKNQLKGVHSVLNEGNDLHLIVDPALFDSNQLFRLIMENNLELTTLVKDELSLEETFLQLTGKSLRD